MTAYIVILLFLIVLFAFAKYCKRFNNPFKLIMFIGKKGSGKTTIISKLSLKYLKQGWIVYSSVKLNIEGVRYFDPKKIGPFVFPEHSVIFTDEVGIIFDNRHFKDFRDDTRDYFKFQRHYRNIVYLFSQTNDIDSKLRNLTDYMFILHNFGNVLSFAQRVSKTIEIVEPTADSEGRIADGFRLEPLWLSLIGMRVAYLTWVPKYVKYFDSFELEKDLPYMPYIECRGLPEPKKKSLFKRKSSNRNAENLAPDES